MTYALSSPQLNINSAVASPDHDAEIDLSKNLTRDFLVQGYAYAGGGNPVNRVEVSERARESESLACSVANAVRLSS